MRSLFLSVCVFTAPLTDKPPKILFPSESQMSIIEMAIGKKSRFIPYSDRLFYEDTVSSLRYTMALLQISRLASWRFKVGPVLLYFSFGFLE